VSTGNPRPEIATARTPCRKTGLQPNASARPDIIVVAEMSDGKFYMGKRAVKVTIGGCGG
jgi:predicted secreted protein